MPGMEAVRSLFGRLDKPAVAVGFCGIGGACKGIQDALGVAPLVAVNHSRAAIAAHAANFPDTIHIQEDILQVAPLRVTRGRKVKYGWLSPDCTHHSRAKGAKPLDSGRRSLANVAIDWVRDLGLDVLFLENVPEFRQWGPLYPDDHPDPALRGRPIKERAGEDFRRWCGELEALGGHVEWRVLRACDYGAPTSRERLYIVVRFDGIPFRWPEPTHGPGRVYPWRTAASCIDWSIPELSIFASPEEARAWAKAVGADGVPKRPLADATLRRVATGLVRFVIESPRPYIIPLRGTSLSHRSAHSIDVPLSTVTAGGTHHGLVSPLLINTRNGERIGQAPRVYDIQQPYPTVTAQGSQGALVTAHLTSFYGQSKGSSLDAPCPSPMANVNHEALVTAWLAKHYTGVVGSSLTDPLGTVTGIDHHSLCQAHLAPAEIAGARRVASFLCTYYGQSIGQDLREPMATVTGHDRFGLVTVDIRGEPWVVYDVSLRMLQPRELARAMGFLDTYKLIGTKAEQVAGIGNAVSPIMAEALVRSHLGLTVQ